MKVIDCVATMATIECAQELLLFVSSLREHHPSLLIVVGTTTAFSNTVMFKQLSVDRNISWVYCLDQYGSIDRKKMESSKGVWFPTRHADFMMEKANLMQLAFERGLTRTGVIFMDCDIVSLSQLSQIPVSCKLAASPHGIARADERLWGKFNGGMLYVSEPHLIFEWKKFTHTSRFFDQASIEDLVDLVSKSSDSFHEFSRQSNYGYWRMFQAPEVAAAKSPLLRDGAFNEVAKFCVEPGKPITYESRPLQSIHTHFFLTTTPPEMRLFNMTMKKWIHASGPLVYSSLRRVLL